MEDDSTFESLFDQYLCPPSPPTRILSEGAIDDASGVMLSNLGDKYPQAARDPFTEILDHSGLQNIRQKEDHCHPVEDRRCVSNGPLVRLRVNQPTNALCLRLEDKG